MISYTSFSFFVLYFGITFLIYSIMPPKAKWCVLLGGSYVFYFISSKGHILPLILSSIIVWGVGLLLNHLDKNCKEKRKLVEKEERKALKAKYKTYKCTIMFVGVIATLSMLLITKYSNFFITSTNSILGSSIDEVSIIQPLGISFFTLQAISYIVDVYYGRIEAERNPLRVSLFLSFMLTIVEGPIARYDQLGKQLNAGKQNDIECLTKGFVRVLWGLFKKVVIADRAVLLVSAVFDSYEDFSGISIIAAILFYTLQLYCEFSGVMDIMCGLGNMLGMELPENFARPFFAKTINEFWQRWHISLGTWLRDYIFYPISFSKGIKNISGKTREKLNPYYAKLIPTSIALFFVWFSNGFWHGAGWKYIVYGLYYYALMMLGVFFEPVFEKVCKAIKINRKSKPYQLFQMVRTFVIVNFGMLIFRAEDLGVAGKMLKSIFTGFDLSVLQVGHKNGFHLSLYDYATIIIGFVILVTISVVQEKGIDIKEKIYNLPYYIKVPLLLVFVFVIIIFGAYGEGYGVVDLIYANF